MISAALQYAIYMRHINLNTQLNTGQFNLNLDIELGH